MKYEKFEIEKVGSSWVVKPKKKLTSGLWVVDNTVPPRLITDHCFWINNLPALWEVDHLSGIDDCF